MDGPGILLGLCDQSEYLHQSPNGRADFKGQFWHEGEACSVRPGESFVKYRLHGRGVGVGWGQGTRSQGDRGTRVEQFIVFS